MEIYFPWFHQWKYISHGFINRNIKPMDSSMGLINQEIIILQTIAHGFNYGLNHHLAHG